MPLRQDLLQPIPGANPAGANLHYDPVYDKVKEARREEADVDQGEWKTARKLADWPLVIKLTSEALATKSKDLQLAAWLTEAMLHQEGVKGLRAGLTLLRGLLERFWDGLHPEPEDGDLEFRAAPLQWVGDYLVAGGRIAPLNKAGHQSLQYAEARALGYEKYAADDEARLDARKAALADGKLAPEEFDKAFDATPKAWYKDLAGDFAGALDALQALDATGGGKCGGGPPR